MSERYYLTVRSVTYGQRGQRALQARGMDCRLSRTPRWMEQRGCGYALEVKDGKLAAAILQEAGIAWEKLYRLEGERRAREVEL